MKFRIGVDIGGTFTDCVVVDEAGILNTFKELSTPRDQSIGLYNVIRKASEHYGLTLQEFLSSAEVFVHGTTVATNTLLTATGAKTGLICTKGFRDTIEMRRAHKDNIWDLFLYTPPPLVPRYLRIGVEERLNYNGEVLRKVNKEDVKEACEVFQEEGVEAVAISTLFSFLNDSHENEIRELVKERLPDVFVSISSEVLPQIREYERSSTTVANAYLGPNLTLYLANLRENLKKDGLTKSFYVTASNGGMLTAETASNHASATLLSGPAAGAAGAMFYTQLIGEKNLILLDMGGTSFDVTLINQGDVTLSTEGEVAGYRVAKPMIDIHTIGAGGGSVAWIDPGGMLAVGPESAFSDPGPVCYDIGGEKPTVTDANLMLGYLNKDFFLGGEMKVNYDKAYQVMGDKIGSSMDLSTEEASYGVFHLVNQNMADAVKVVSVQKGHDPREFALVSVGGACSIHACKIAEEIGAQKVVVPTAASVFCAMGMLETDIRLDNVFSYNATIPGLDLDDFNRNITLAEEKALEDLLSEGVSRENTSLLRFLDVRYVGQHHEVTIEMPNNCKIEESHIAEISQTFHDAHEKLYSYSTPETPIEIINLRITGVGHVEKTGIKEGTAVSALDPSQAVKTTRKVYFEEYGDFQDTCVYDRNQLVTGNYIEGPAVIEERTTTIIIHPRWTGKVDQYGNFLMEVKK